jgi:branched-chain amino acid transport system substrate-binding protein
MSGAVTDDTAPARAAGVALIGATPTAAAILGSSNMFLPSETSAPALTYGYLADAVAAGGRNLAVLYCQEDSGCGAEHDAAVKSGYAKAAGLSVVMDQPVSIAQPDFTSECLSARSAGADTMLVIVDANTVRRVVTSCERQNVQLRYLVTPAQVTVSSAGPPPDGLLTTYPVAPWFVKDTPATAERARVIDPDAGSAQAYSSAELFRAVVEHAGDDVSRAGILAAARSLRAETTGGLTPPVAVGGPVRCWFSLLTRGGTWTAPHGTQVRCGPKP